MIWLVLNAGASLVPWKLALFKVSQNWSIQTKILKLKPFSDWSWGLHYEPHQSRILLLRYRIYHLSGKIWSLYHERFYMKFDITCYKCEWTKIYHTHHQSRSSFLQTNNPVKLETISMNAYKIYRYRLGQLTKQCFYDF